MTHPQNLTEGEWEQAAVNAAKAANHAQRLTVLRAKIMDEVGTTLFLGHRWNDEGFCFNCGEAVNTNQWKQCVSPITLEDVLRALADVEIAITSLGNFIPFPHNNEAKWTQWKLGKSLDSQSEETISFLFDLLCS